MMGKQDNERKSEEGKEEMETTKKNSSILIQSPILFAFRQVSI